MCTVWHIQPFFPPLPELVLWIDGAGEKGGGKVGWEGVGVREGDNNNWRTEIVPICHLCVTVRWQKSKDFPQESAPQSVTVDSDFKII